MKKKFRKRTWTGLTAAVLLIAAILLAGLSGCASTTGASPSVSPTPSASAPDATPSASTSTDAATPSSETTAPAETASPTASPTPTESAMPSPSPTATASAQPSDAAPSASAPSASATSPSADVPDSAYLGQWTVTQVLAYGDVGTYRQSDAEKMIGEKLKFEADKAIIINDRPKESPGEFKGPKYVESTVTKDAFLESFRMSFDKLGITADAVSQVNVVVTGTGGCTLLVKDSTTLVLAAGGTYFELTKA